MVQTLHSFRNGGVVRNLVKRVQDLMYMYENNIFPNILRIIFYTYSIIFYRIMSN